MSSAKLLGGCLAAVFLLFAADKAGVITMRQPPRPAPSATTPGLAPPPRPAAPAAVAMPAAPAAPAVAPPPVLAEAETPDALPDGPGRDDTFYRCTACHSTALIRRSGFTRAQWDDLMDWMVQRQNMPPLEPDMRRIIVDYLAEAFPPRRTSPRGGRNPFAE